MEHQGQIGDESKYVDLFYGVELLGWEKGTNITQEEIDVLLRLKIITNE